MELKDFVSETFKQIVEGVKEARAIGEDGKGIASSSRTKMEKTAPGLMQDLNGALYTVVDFDVAVTAATKADGSAGIDVFVFKLQGGIDTEDQTVSRVKFSIPMKFNFY
ncbi:hypothetical protein [Rhizobium leguminosarum]|uniref:hypothetical protein n=1 Tax=Rhizobium leguminosarum TaxID=384 RepID=UPI001C93F54D|nr:hypothetical protein [Rhizobium leguminosarum]MBY5812903.1 hypothetical protein [Rhizobium leguminosarum]